MSNDKERLQMIDRYEVDDFFGPVSEVIDRLQAVQEKHPEAVKVSIEDIWTGYEDRHTEVWVTRLETNAELSNRLLAEQEAEAEKLRKLKAARKEAERKRLAGIAKLEAEMKKLKEGV
jgi:hypothetical protein